jgi:two-component system, LytTR family, response regulator
MHNLHNTVYRLKKTLKDAGNDVDLIHSNEGYLLQVGPGLSDFEVLRGFMNQTVEIDEQNVAVGVKLLRSCNGLLFGGKDYARSLGLASEVSAHQASLCRMIAEFYRTIGDRTALKETMLTYLSSAQLDEEMKEQLLHLYAEDGETSLFCTHYERYVNRLATETDWQFEPDMNRFQEVDDFVHFKGEIVLKEIEGTFYGVKGVQLFYRRVFQRDSECAALLRKR